MMISRGLTKSTYVLQIDAILSIKVIVEKVKGRVWSSDTLQTIESTPEMF